MCVFWVFFCLILGIDLPDIFDLVDATCCLRYVLVLGLLTFCIESVWFTLVENDTSDLIDLCDLGWKCSGERPFSFRRTSWPFFSSVLLPKERSTFSNKLPGWAGLLLLVPRNRALPIEDDADSLKGGKRYTKSSSLMAWSGTLCSKSLPRPLITSRSFFELASSSSTHTPQQSALRKRKTPKAIKSARMSQPEEGLTVQTKASMHSTVPFTRCVWLLLPFTENMFQ